MVSVLTCGMSTPSPPEGGEGMTNLRPNVLDKKNKRPILTHT